MAIRLDNIMERWATLFKEIRHSESAPRFFRYNDEMALDEFVQRYKNINGPVVGVRTHLEGRFDTAKRMDYPEEQFVVMMRANPKDYLAQADAKQRCKRIMKQFLVYLEHLKKEAQRSGDRTDPLGMLKLEDIRYDTLGPIANEWHAVFCTIENNEYEKLCYSETDYLTEEEAGWTDLPSL